MSNSYYDEKFDKPCQGNFVIGKDANNKDILRPCSEHLSNRAREQTYCRSCIYRLRNEASNVNQTYSASQSQSQGDPSSQSRNESYNTSQTQYQQYSSSQPQQYGGSDSTQPSYGTGQSAPSGSQGQGTQHSVQPRDGY